MSDPAPTLHPCPACGTANEAGRKFCGQCGTRLAVTCPACGSPNSSSARFCGECGTGLGEASTPQADSDPSQPAGSSAVAPSPGAQAQAAELKLVSILFADLVGFTGAAEQHDPESVRETLTRYFDLASTTIERYGGTVEKFIGDAVMAVWGTPTAHEDDPERAVRAALDLVDAVQELGGATEFGELRLRAAVMTGEAAVTIGARNQGLVAGDVVNAASRLQGLAEPGTVLVDESTARAAAAAITFEPAGTHELRGRTLPVTAHRARRVVGKRGGVGRSENLEAPFVGRDGQLRLMRELYHATANDKRARLVSIIGQAGIGKSRLVWEFSKYTDGLAENLWWHEGRSPAYGEGVTFWALGEMIRQRARILEGEDAEATSEKLTAAVNEYVTDTEERRWIERALRQLLGLHEDQPLERDELFAAWRTFFDRLAERSPTVLIFQDMHWADSGLLDFIEHLLEWSRSQPIYVVSIARPDLLERRPTWGAGQRSFTSISLEPLPDGAMREMLEGLVPGLPPSAVQGILTRADGVPLYAVETVRMLLHEGRLEPADGVYRPVGDLTQIDVPGSLQALISARLDALDPADRLLLQSAAVLGQTFAIAALAAVSGEHEDGLEPRLRGLVRREVLQIDSDPRSPERGQYGFVQALIREVAYGTLPKRERRERHLAAARYFEQVGDDELAGVLARHYLDAHRASAGGPEAEALAAQARVALRAAAERATSLGSMEQAVAYLREALAVTVDDRERAELYDRIGIAADASGRMEEAIQAHGEAIAGYRALGLRPELAEALARSAGYLLRSGQVGAARELLQPLMTEFADLSGTPVWIELNMGLARSMIDDQPTEALALLERVLEAAERLDLLSTIVQALHSRAGALILLHRAREARAILNATLDMAEANGMPVEQLKGYVSYTFLEVSSDPRAGLAAGRTGLDLAGRLGLRRFIFEILGNAARCAFRTGDWDWAAKALADALALGPEGFNDFELADEAIVIESLRGREVSAEASRVEALVKNFDDPQATAWHTLALAWIAFAEGRLDEALRAAEVAAASTQFYAPEAHPLAARIALRLGDGPGLARAVAALDASGAHGSALNVDRLTMAAAAAHLAGERRDAIRLYHEALERWRDLGLAWDLALCQADYALAFPDEPDADEQRAEARDTFTRLGAITMLHVLGEPPFGPETEPMSGDRAAATGGIDARLGSATGAG